MKLVKVHIKEFQSIQDSTEFDIGDVTCLVGKNEAGKTALLKALYHLNPVHESDGDFDVTDDYPRGAVEDYKDAVEAEAREPADVVLATYELEPKDIAAVEETFGSQCLEDKYPTVTLSKGYSNECEYNGLSVDEPGTLKYMIKCADLPAQLATELLTLATAEEMIARLSDAEQTEATQKLTSALQSISDDGLSAVVFSQILDQRLPKYLYFDEYYQINGQDNLDSLKQRVAQDKLQESDYPLLGLIELAGLDLAQLTQSGRTEALFSKLEAAANSLSQRVLRHWSQNQHLRMRFDIRTGQPADPPGMTNGVNIWGRVEDTRQFVTTSLGSRSRGFVWFFSFLAWYSQLRKKDEKLILLLDEPGLSLHAKAQGDLLRYFENELKPHHQVLYTTHSPFMVDPMHFNRVRIVQDLSIETPATDLPDDKKGTKVITEVLEATQDSLFPLQGALGYEIHQTLFIGPNSLIVEGVSDLLYIQTISALLQRRGETGLSGKWTITPVGGIGNVSTFVALIGAQEDMNLAVLIDYHKRDQQAIENLYKSKLLKQSSVLTFADFLPSEEADMEDMFQPEFYLKLVNAEFGVEITLEELPRAPRILTRIELFSERGSFPGDIGFNHYRAARYFSEGIGGLEGELGEVCLDRFRKAFAELNALLVSD